MSNDIILLTREVAEAADFGTAAARKSGRNPQWPYVPVVRSDSGRTAQVLARAFATRVEAVACAQVHIDAQRAALAVQLRDPRYRALREQYGLPRDITVA